MVRYYDVYRHSRRVDVFGNDQPWTTFVA